MFKLCSVCQSSLPARMFYKRGNRLRSACKSCQVGLNKKFYDPEWRKTYYAENRTDLINASDKWNKANRERYRIIVRVSASNVRARKYGVEGQLSTIEVVKKFRRLGDKCFYCGSVGTLTIDHKTPMIKGGLNVLANVVPACRNCNYRKGLRTATEFKRLS